MAKLWEGRSSGFDSPLEFFDTKPYAKFQRATLKTLAYRVEKLSGPTVFYNRYGMSDLDERWLMAAMTLRVPRNVIAAFWALRGPFGATLRAYPRLDNQI